MTIKYPSSKCHQQFQEVSLELNTAKIHLSSAEIEYILENVSNPLLSTKNETCEPVKNIFFLKSSKTGGTTVMSILQRYGMRNNLDFLMGENHGGMYHNNRPFNLGTIKIYRLSNKIMESDSRVFIY